jgi:hypothetical protein
MSMSFLHDAPWLRAMYVHQFNWSEEQVELVEKVFSSNCDFDRFRLFDFAHLVFDRFPKN